MISYKLTARVHNTVLYSTQVVKILCNNFIDVTNGILQPVKPYDNHVILTIISCSWYYYDTKTFASVLIIMIHNIIIS